MHSPAQYLASNFIFEFKSNNDKYDVGGCDVTERDEEKHLITLNDGMMWSCSK